MMLGGTSSEVNPNSHWLNSRGMWLSYIIGIVLFHLMLLSLPFVTVAWAWTLTNISHNLTMFFMLHLVKGTPWDSGDQGKCRWLTHWEQIDNGEQFTATKKFLTVVPIVFQTGLFSDMGDFAKYGLFDVLYYPFQFIPLVLNHPVYMVIKNICSAFTFFLTSFYTKYETLHFILNFAFLAIVLLPKLPQFHMVRLFGINKY